MEDRNTIPYDLKCEPGDIFKDASTGVEYIYSSKTVHSKLTEPGWEVFTG